MRSFRGLPDLVICIAIQTHNKHCRFATCTKRVPATDNYQPSLTPQDHFIDVKVYLLKSSVRTIIYCTYCTCSIKCMIISIKILYVTLWFLPLCHMKEIANSCGPLYNTLTYSIIAKKNWTSPVTNSWLRPCLRPFLATHPKN